MKNLRRAIAPYILPVVLYSIVIALVFGGAIFPQAGQMIFGDDVHHQYYFYREFFNGFLKQGIFPWWNPYNFSGTPFIADPIVNIWYPPTWLFTILPLNVAYSWHLALHIVFAMTGMYVLLRCLSSRPLSRDPMNTLLDSSFRWNDMHVAAWVGGLLFGLSGFFMARTWAGHVDVIAAASWMPWVVAAFAANFKFQISNFKLENQGHKQEQRRLMVITSLALAAQLLAGYHTMAFFTLEIVGLMTVFFCFQKHSIVPAFRALLVLLLAIGLAGIQWIPEIEFVRQSIRNYSLPYSWASYGAMTWESLKQFLNPFFFGDQFTYHGPPPNFIEQSAFVGRIGLALAIFGGLMFFTKFFFYRKKKADKSNKIEMLLPIVFVVTAIFGLWISLGPNAPIDLQKILWTLIPIYHSLRIPPRHLILFVFGATGLAAYGLQLVKIRAIQIIIAVLVVVEMVGFGHHFIELRPTPETREDSTLLQILRHDSGNQAIKPYRLLQNFGVWIPQREALEFDATMSKGIFSATGYDVAILKSYYEFIDAAAGNGGSSILAQDVQVPYFNRYPEAIDFLNVTYIMVPRRYDPFVEDSSGRAAKHLRLVREDSIRDYRLYENTAVLPRFYLVPRATVLATPNDVLDAIRTGKVDFRNEVLISDNRPSNQMRPHEVAGSETRGNECQYGKLQAVEVMSFLPNKIRLSTNTSCSEYLVSSEVWYPGWQASIDGKKTDIIKGNHAFRTVFVPAGKHMVSYVYRPTIFYISSGISIITVFVLLLWVRKLR